jgi:hypothetical protein
VKLTTVNGDGDYSGDYDVRVDAWYLWRLVLVTTPREVRTVCICGYGYNLFRTMTCTRRAYGEKTDIEMWYMYAYI